MAKLLRSPITAPGWIRDHGCRVAILALGTVLIVIWQLGFFYDPAPIQHQGYRLKAASGIKYYYADYQRFYYFYHYLGLFPVATTGEIEEYGRAAARDLIEWRGDSLVMEIGHTIRTGENGKLFLFVPSAWLKGSAKGVRIRPAITAYFMLSLVAAFLSFGWFMNPGIATVVVILIGSNPFQLWETYAEENLFGLSIPTALLMLAACLPMLLGLRLPRWYVLATPIACGLFLATIREVRAEPVAIIVSVAAAVVTWGAARRATRLWMVVLLLGSFLLAGQAFSWYWSYKFEEAARVVETAGGHPMPEGIRQSHHELWHPLFCGLGDFDDTHGYRWDDNVAYDYAIPVMKERYGIDVAYAGSNTDNYFWDDSRIYYREIFDYPQYHAVIRDKVLADVAADPWWYAGILAKRTWRILSAVTPAAVSIDGIVLSIPQHGLPAVILCVILAAWRRWPELKVIAFTVPLSFIAWFVYSGGGNTYYAIYHLLGLALVMHWAGAWLTRRALAMHRTSSSP